MQVFNISYLARAPFPPIHLNLEMPLVFLNGTRNGTLINFQKPVHCGLINIPNTSNGSTLKTRLLITGHSGFVGSRLIAYCASHPCFKWEVCLPSKPYNLLAQSDLNTVIMETRPDAVIHLAAQSNVPDAFRNPTSTLQVNLLGTLNLLQALKANQFKGAFLYVSSGDVYGQVPEAYLPISEAQPAIPRNPYGVSKLAAEALCRQWSFVEPWRIMIARPFNHIGPGQSDAFVIPAIARQLIAIRHGQQPATLELGDIDVTRDFLDVNDVISAYFSLLERGENGETYNVCSGVEQSVRGLMESLCDLSGVHPQIIQDPSKMRRAEQRRVCGSFAKLGAATGWKPTITITQTLKNILSDWESRTTQ